MLPLCTFANSCLKVPTLRPCQPFRARSFPPVLAGQTSACFCKACITGRDRDASGLRKAPTSPASGLLNLQPISINVQYMFNDMLCELPFVRVVVTQAVMFIAMLCELLFVRVLIVANWCYFKVLTQAALHFADAWQHPLCAEMSMPAPRIKPRTWVYDKPQELSRRISRHGKLYFES